MFTTIQFQDQSVLVDLVHLLLQTHQYLLRRMLSVIKYIMTVS